MTICLVMLRRRSNGEDQTRGKSKSQEGIKADEKVPGSVAEWNECSG